jgi:tetratricopeptide (TPR) repeat protein
VGEAPFETAHLDDLDAIPGPGTLVWRPIRRRFGIEAFGMNAYTAATAGEDLVEEHTEGKNLHQEVYFVARGHATFRVAGEEIDAPAGTFVFIRDPSVQRHAVAREPDSTVIAVGGPAGVPFEESSWEYFFAAGPHVNAGDYDRAVEVTAEGLDRHGSDPALLYNLACFEALAGRREDALGHLGRAYELDPERISEWAKDDPDLNSIRDEFDFDA